MLKKIHWILILLWGLSAWGQECPEPIYPLPNDTDVPLDAILRWTPVDSVPGYIITLGSEPFANDILEKSVGNRTTLPVTEARLGLPQDSLIFMTVTMIFPNQADKEDIVCELSSFRTVAVTAPPPCTELSSPQDGSENVPTGAAIRWDYSVSATSYVLSIGTTPGGTEFYNDNVGNTLSYSPPDGLDELQLYYVRITPVNEIGSATCTNEFSFRTGPFATLPSCTTMVYPMDEAFNVSLLPTIQWNAVDGADGYYVSLDTSPFFNEDPILDRVEYTDTFFSISENRPLDTNSIFFIRIIPYNEAGEALDCEPTTFSTLLGCGPFFDAEGNPTDLSPELNFPEAVGICKDGGSTVSVEDVADGYRWFQILPFGAEKQLGEGPEFEIPEPGEYRLEIYNVISGADGDFECRSEQIFTVTESESAVIERTPVELGAGTIDIEVVVSGIGDYEFALDEAGPYQDSNRFTNLPIENYRVFVRDKKGCGITEKPVELDLTLEGFPKFFTPNGDGINDTWQFIPPPSGINPIRQLHIFDRYGKLLVQVDPRSKGWNGTFNGRPLPAADYWFRAVNESNQVLQGHFSLKR